MTPRAKEVGEEEVAAGDCTDDHGYPVTLNAEARERVLREFATATRKKSRHMVGYPYNFREDDANGTMQSIRNCHLNNLGDPFIRGSYQIHSRAFELGVLQWFASLWHLPWSDVWGYVAASGSEANLQALFLARERLPPDAILFCGAESHYSIFKAARVLKLETCTVQAIPNHGGMDVAAFKMALEGYKGRPVIVAATIGTTLRGAVDDLAGICEALAEANIPRDRFYIHLDGALGGMLVPLLQRSTNTKPIFSFQEWPIDSACTSGHKFLGCVVPSAVFIVRQEIIDSVFRGSNDIGYIGSRDTTLLGSRDGHTPVILWELLSRTDVERLEEEALTCVSNARKFAKMLLEAGCSAQLNNLSTTVVFKTPGPEVCKQWQLAVEKEEAHIVVMPHVTESLIAELAKQIIADSKGMKKTAVDVLPVKTTTTTNLINLEYQASAA